MKRILCEINEEKDGMQTQVSGTNIDLFVMTSAILKNVSGCIGAPIPFVALACAKLAEHIDSEESQEETEKPEIDGDFDITLDELQQLLNDVKGED